MFRIPTTLGRSGFRSKYAFRPQAEGLERRRLLSAGGLDTTFDGDGFLYATFSYKGSGVPSTANAVEIQANDGKILAAGRTPGDDIGVVRVNPDGTLDTSFGSGGRATTDLNKKSDNAFDMALLADGKILVAGHADMSTKAASDLDFALVRYASNGGLDTSFGVGGKVTTNLGTSGSKEDSANALAVSPIDGKILVAGSTRSGTYSDSGLVRYNASG